MRQKSSKKTELNCSYTAIAELDDPLLNTIKLLHPDGNWETSQKLNFRDEILFSPLFKQHKSREVQSNQMELYPVCTSGAKQVLTLAGFFLYTGIKPKHKVFMFTWMRE